MHDDGGSGTAESGGGAFGDLRAHDIPECQAQAVVRRLRPRAAEMTISEPAVMIGSSAAMRELRRLIALYAGESEPVFIVGETGAGKELIARELHRLSPRAPMPYVVKNAARVDRDLAGSDFFGHVKGAFTGAAENRKGLFEIAHLGTLHLDEIADLPADLQAGLLRVIEDGVVAPVGAQSAFRVNVRLIASTNADIASAVSARRFRADLYHRLSVLRLKAPPLRERGDDVVEIATHLVKEKSRASGARLSLTAAAADTLKAYAWPGNVRELKNVMTRAMVAIGDGPIKPSAIVFDSCEGEHALAIDEGRDLVTRYLAAKALEATKGNVARAAKLTRLNRSTLHELRNRLDGDGRKATALREDVRNFLGF